MASETGPTDSFQGRLQTTFTESVISLVARPLPFESCSPCASVTVIDFNAEPVSVRCFLSRAIFCRVHWRKEKDPAGRRSARSRRV